MSTGEEIELPSVPSWARIVVLSGVWATACATLAQVPTTDHPEHVASLFEASHRAIGLFLLSAEGYPVVGPTAGVSAALLWAAYFVAPLLTASFLADAVQQLQTNLVGPERAASRARGHLVLCGFGKHGRLVVRHFLAKHPGEEVVVLDSSPLPPFVAGPWDHAVPVLREELSADPRGALTRGGIEKAAVLVASTGDDVLNVSLCLTGRELVPTGLRLVALVHDNGMSSVLKATLDARGVEMLDVHDLAAARLVNRLVGTGLFGEPRSLVIIGYGHFGQALCRVVLDLQKSTERVPGIIVVDVVPRMVPVGFERRVSFIEGNAENPETLGYALRKADAFGGRSIVALCTDDDNLRVVFGLRRHLPEGVVLLARLFRHPPSDVAKVLEGSGIECFELEELLAERMAEVLT